MTETVSPSIRTVLFLGRQHSIDIEKPPKEVDIPSHEILSPSGGVPTGHTCPVRKAYVFIENVTGPGVTHSITISCESAYHPYSMKQQKRLSGHTQCHTSIKKFV